MAPSSFWDTYADGTPMYKIPKSSYGGGLGHCDKCDNPRMTYVHAVKGLKHYCDKHMRERADNPHK